MYGHIWSTRDAVRLCGLSAGVVRALAKDGFVAASSRPAELTVAATNQGPGRALRFDFQDLAVLRLARQLVVAGLPVRRLRRALAGIREQTASHNVPMSAAGCVAFAGRVVAFDAVACWEVDTGAALAERPEFPPPAQPFALLPQPSSDGDDPAWQAAMTLEDLAASELNVLPGHGAVRQADHWFNVALTIEEHDSKRAYAYYMRAIACDPEHVESIINIGRLCSADGDAPRAAAFFRLAIRIDAAHPVAHFNLAVTQHDQGMTAQAIANYRRALCYDPKFADAHYNLGTLLDKVGLHSEAQQHFAAYRANQELR